MAIRSAELQLWRHLGISKVVLLSAKAPERNASFIIVGVRNNQLEFTMKKLILATAVATMISGAAFAQANPSAPQPSSSGLGVNQPGTTSTGTAVDRPDSDKMGTSGMNKGSMQKDGMAKDGMNKGSMSK
jgi:hypothetical protein